MKTFSLFGLTIVRTKELKKHLTEWNQLCITAEFLEKENSLLESENDALNASLTNLLAQTPARDKKGRFVKRNK